MLLDADSLANEVLRLPWHTILSSPIVPAVGLPNDPPAAITAAVPLLGIWSGWIRLRCDLRLAHEIASRVRAGDLIRPWDLDEAVQWLATTLAGALRGAIDPEAKLGEVAIVNSVEPWTPRACRPCARLLFESRGRPLGIALDERIEVTTHRSGFYESDLDVPVAVPPASDTKRTAAGDGA